MIPSWSVRVGCDGVVRGGGQKMKRNEIGQGGGLRSKR